MKFFSKFCTLNNLDYGQIKVFPELDLKSRIAALFIKGNKYLLTRDDLAFAMV